MTTTEPARDVANDDLSFELKCCHDQPLVRCVMYRHHNWDGDDDFSVRAVEDDRWLGWGETKDDAVFAAILTLGDEHAARMLAARP